MLNEYVSVSEAVRLSGLSTRTLKRMAKEGRLKFSKSPGGHIRIARADLDGLLRHSPSSPAPVSSVLQNKKERVEELVLETQELRARRELDRLQEEDADRDRQRAAARRAEAATRELALAEQRSRRTSESERRKREQREAEAERQQAEFERRWDRWARERLAVLEWLSFEQRETVLRMVAETVRAHGLGDEDVMQSILSDSIARLCAPWEFERQSHARREELIEQTIWQLPQGATDIEKARAATDARAVLSQIPLSAKDWEIRVALSSVVEPIAEAIEERKAAKSRALRKRIHKDSLISHGVQHVSRYIGKLYAEDEIARDAYLDFEWRHDVEKAAKTALETELTGAKDETCEDAEQIAEDIIEEELE